MTKKEKMKKLITKLAVFGFILIGINLVQMAIYGTDAKAFPESAAILFVVAQTIIYLVAIIEVVLVIKYLSIKER